MTIFVMILTIALVCTGLALTILRRLNVVMRLTLAIFSSYITILYVAMPVTAYAGFIAYEEWAFIIAMGMHCVTFFYGFTRHGFVQGFIFRKTTPLIQAIPQAPVPVLPIPDNRTVQFSTQGAKSVWEL